MVRIFAEMLKQKLHDRSEKLRLRRIRRTILFLYLRKDKIWPMPAFTLS